MLTRYLVPKVYKNLWNIDLYGTDFKASAAQRACKRQALSLFELLKLGRKNSSNRSRVHASVGVTTGLPVNRTHVLARAAANTLQRLATHLIRQNVRATIVQQNQMKVFWTVAFVNSSPDRVVRIHALACSTARQKLQQHFKIFETGNDLVDTSDRNQSLWQRKAHPAIAFALYNADTAGFGNQKICAAHRRFNGEKFLAKKPASCVRKILGGIAEVRQVHLTLKNLPHLLPVLVQCWNNNV